MDITTKYDGMLIQSKDQWHTQQFSTSLTISMANIAKKDPLDRLKIPSANRHDTEQRRNRMAMKLTLEGLKSQVSQWKDTCTMLQDIHDSPNSSRIPNIDTNPLLQLLK